MVERGVQKNLEIVDRELTLDSPQLLELKGSLPNFVAQDVGKVMTRRMWKEMPGRGSALWMKYSVESEIEGIVYDPFIWQRKPNAKISLEDESTQHVKDRRKFRCAVINLEEAQDFSNLSKILKKVSGKLSREKGNSEIEKPARAAPIFLIADEGNKETLEKILKEQDSLFSQNVVEKKFGKTKNTIGEVRINKKSEMPHINLIENSKKKKYDYLGIALRELLMELRINDSRIANIHIDSEYLGERSAGKRLRHSNNYLRDIKSALSGVGIEVEYSCGCRFAKYRERGNVYIDRVGSCPNDVKIDESELVDFSTLEIFRESVESNDMAVFYEKMKNKSDNNLIKTVSTVWLISSEMSEMQCPDNCGRALKINTFAGREGDTVKKVIALTCPGSGRFFGKTITYQDVDKFVEEYTK